MRLLHYSSQKILKLYQFDNSVPSHQELTGFKPRGLWVSVEGEYDWKSWCEAEGFRLEDLTCVHEVTLAENANILRISTVEELDAFHEKYKVKLFPGAHSEGIDWMRVKKEYQGIIISPYFWERRLGADMIWYYGWDCASGCIWDDSAVLSIHLISSESYVSRKTKLIAAWWRDFIHPYKMRWLMWKMRRWTKQMERTQAQKESAE